MTVTAKFWLIGVYVPPLPPKATVADELPLSMLPGFVHGAPDPAEVPVEVEDEALLVPLAKERVVKLPSFSRIFGGLIQGAPPNGVSTAIPPPLGPSDASA